MKAMVFAAGFGTRLAAVTNGSTPKCLVQVAGKSMLEHVVERLKAAGVTEIIINLHHLPKPIEEHVRSRSNFGIRIEFSYEERILGTGGGLKNVEKFFSDGKPFIVHNSDVYSTIDLAELYQEHLNSKALATLAVLKRETERPLLFDGENTLVGFRGKSDSELVRKSDIVKPLGFTGIQVISKKFFDFLRDESGEFSTVRAYLKAAKAGEVIKAFEVKDALWFDMGTPEKLAELRKAVETQS